MKSEFVEPICAAVRDYRPLDGRYDEMLATAMDHVTLQKFIVPLENLGVNDSPCDAIRRAHPSRTRLHLNIYGDIRGQARPWRARSGSADHSSEEWRKLEAGLAQRRNWLNLLLADFYGPQQLVQGRRAATGVASGDPAFLRPCHGIVPPKNVFLFLHRRGPARSATGMVGAVRSHTGSSGAGYALENPMCFRACCRMNSRGPRRAAGGLFSNHANSLRSRRRARRASDVVLLTPRPITDVLRAFYCAFIWVFAPLKAAIYVRAPAGVFENAGWFAARGRDFGAAPTMVCAHPAGMRAIVFSALPGLVEAARAQRDPRQRLGSGVVETPRWRRSAGGCRRPGFGEESSLASRARFDKSAATPRNESARSSSGRKRIVGAAAKSRPRAANPPAFSKTRRSRTVRSPPSRAEDQ